jgi:uncharacterized membrane protein HdeD (DUF308 family)
MFKHMPLLLAEHWWSPFLRGLVAIAVGIIALALPGITLGALVILFGAYALVDGIAALIAAYRSSRDREHWGMLLFEGIAGLVAAAVTVVFPPLTALVLVYLIGAWALVTGVLEIAAAIRLRKFIAGEWLLALSGVASMIFGILVLAVPLAGALAIAVIVGVYALIFGVILVGFGIRLRSWTKHPGGAPSIQVPAH